ncbi:hypothetical protein CPB83DRAFT_850088 [Crepidotus variabilis]|uniref:Uncharacterized protein n=1 Tax=Crepidotus variabilis TaxID=179855 RepID=A0A9P6JS89_9AGAR|nr:hypothetical protein CPB83DRAFT_850088 [Crepidotus variabilis]
MLASVERGRDTEKGKTREDYSRSDSQATRSSSSGFASDSASESAHTSSSSLSSHSGSGSGSIQSPDSVPVSSSGLSSDYGSRSASSFGTSSVYPSSGQSSRASKRPRLDTDSDWDSSGFFNSRSGSSSNSTSHSSLGLESDLRKADMKLKAIIRPPTSRPRIPVEIIDSILFLLAPKHLYPVMLANTVLYPIARRRFYHTVTIDAPVACIKFLQQIVLSARAGRKHNVLPGLIRSLDLNVSLTSGRKPKPGSSSSQSPPSFTRSFYILLSNALRLMTSLSSLSIDLPKTHSPTWIFEGCSFKLKQLTTSMHCHRPLAEFLETQEEIEELTLRGFQSESGWMFWTLLSGAAGGGVPPPAAAAIGVGAGTTSPPSSDILTFTLSQESLPRLRSFNAIHAGPSTIHTVLSDRPVQVASIPLFPGLSLPALEALSTASKPLKRLSVISFDPGAPAFLFEELGKRFGEELEALHLVMLMTDYDVQMLEGVGERVLGYFRCLKYITFMAAAPADESNPVDESRIAKQWHRACPTLRTIILPKGKVWFQGDPDVEGAIPKSKGKAKAEGESSSSGSDVDTGGEGDDKTDSGGEGMWIGI